MQLLRHQVVERILENGLVPVFYNGNVETAKRVIDACAKGGANVVEFTNRGPLAYRVFGELVAWRDAALPNVILGGGTIMEEATASLYINSGADFIVGPVFSAEVARICNRRKVAYIPGCSTFSEISTAEEMGADIIKLAPAKAVGPDFIKVLLGPSPWSLVMPSGGVEASRDDIFSWIKAGAKALNMGTSLVRKDLVNAGKFDQLTEKVQNCISWVREARLPS